MRNQKGNENASENAIAVAIDKDKGSQYALKWAVEHLLSRGQTVTLIHVKQKPSTIPTPMGSHVSVTDVNDGVAKVFKSQIDNQAKELFLPFRAFCTRKDIKTNEIILEDVDIGKSLCDYIKLNLVENLVVGSPSRNSFVRRFRATDVPTSVSKAAPDFCTVYVISKGKISSVRSATMPVPNPPPRPLPNQVVPVLSPPEARPVQEARPIQQNSPKANEWTPRYASPARSNDMEIKSPFNRSRGSTRSYPELPAPDLNSDISFVSSGRPSLERTPQYLFYDSPEHSGMGPPRLSYGSEMDNMSNGSPLSRMSDPNFMHGFSSCSDASTNMSWSSSQNVDDVEAEMRRLRQELRQTMDMYSSACKEALTAKQRAMELNRWKVEEQQRLEEARISHETALAIAEKERAKTKAAIEAAEAAHRIAEMEAHKRRNAEMKAQKESEEKKKVLDSLAQNDVRYRKYTIDEIEAATDNFAECRKVGEGGYGPVYRCYLDHTPAAIKILRPDAAHGRSQFQQEVEVLSSIRHPNMVLLLGACPEYGCLVYEYMSNGSLEDRLARRGNTPPLSWQARFRISAEIATGLLFLHQTKPEPLVHRDLKPGNILLDRNFVSKISDVGLARLVPPSVANTVTQYRMTATAGTFCYIDPEYQQTGMLGIKSDIYSLGIMLLQIITARPPMGLTHHVEKSIEKGTFAEMLDPVVPDWPVEEALVYAKLALQCAELRRKDRPDLKTVLLPELNRLRALAEENTPEYLGSGSAATSPSHSQAYVSSQDNLSGPTPLQSGYASSGYPFDSSYTSEKRSSS